MDIFESFFLELGLIKRYLDSSEERLMTAWQIQKLKERICDMEFWATDFENRVIQISFLNDIEMRFPSAACAAAYNGFSLSIVNLVLDKKILMFDNKIWVRTDDVLVVDPKFLKQHMRDQIVNKNLLVI